MPSPPASLSIPAQPVQFSILRIALSGGDVPPGPILIRILQNRRIDHQTPQEHHKKHDRPTKRIHPHSKPIKWSQPTETRGYTEPEPGVEEEARVASGFEDEAGEVVRCGVRGTEVGGVVGEPGDFATAEGAQDFMDILYGAMRGDVREGV